MSQKSPRPIDALIGARIRARRLMIGMSQETLADAVGLTFQQIQKYEKGLNRVSVGRLIDIASALKAEVITFLDERGPDTLESAGLATDKTTVDLLRAFNQLQSRELRQAVVHLVQTAAEQATSRGRRRKEEPALP